MRELLLSAVVHKTQSLQVENRKDKGLRLRSGVPALGSRGRRAEPAGPARPLTTVWPQGGS